MDNQIPDNAFILIRQSGYRGSAINVLHSILSLSRNNGYCYASNETLAADANVTIRHIKRVIKKLKKDGIIAIKYTGRANHITINFERLQERTEMSPQMGHKCHLRSDQNVTSEVTKMSPQMGLKCHPTKQVLKNETKQQLTDTGSVPKAPLASVYLPTRMERAKAVIEEFNLLPSIKPYLPQKKFWSGEYPDSSPIALVVAFTENSDWEAQWMRFKEEYSGSDFLQGGGQNGNLNSINWLFKPENFEKVVSGKYRGKPSNMETFRDPKNLKNGTPTVDMSDDFELMKRWGYTN